MISLFVIAAMCASYFVVSIFLTWLFEKPFPAFSKRSILSVALIATSISFAYVVSSLIPDYELGNRFQHGFGGGFTAFLVCFLAVRDVQLGISRIRFAAVAFLIVTVMGVGNEILEFFVQTHSNYVFSTNPLDTWRDLTSNAVGASIATLAFFPFLKKD